MKRLLRAGVLGLTATPERLLRASFGDPPRSDRGIEQDLHTHALLSVMRLAKLGELHRMTPAKARRHYQDDGQMISLPAPPLAEQRDFQIPGPAGPLPARLYRPLTDAATPLPLLLWFHGGGFVIGDLDTHNNLCTEIAHQMDLPVVAVDYRRAPEHPFPAAVDDCEVAARWIASSPALQAPRNDKPDCGQYLNRRRGNRSAA